MDRVEAWTVSQAADVLSATSISPPEPADSSPATVRGTRVTLSIPLDDTLTAPDPPAAAAAAAAALAANPPSSRVHTVHKRREPVRRDSQKRREALLKGKEGSRQRRRWENDRLLNNPHAESPLPGDWEAKPTHPVRTVPYFLASLWDAEFAAAAAATKARAGGVANASQQEAAAENVRRELRARMKKSGGAKGLLMDLEEEVRGFVERWKAKERELEGDRSPSPDSDSDADEIVFVGRNGAMHDHPRKGEERLEKDKLIFRSLVDDHGAAFGRYLVHSIAQYYGLKTWSITTGDPARREAYVGLKTDPKTRRPSLSRAQMPRPLWAVV